MRVIKDLYYQLANKKVELYMKPFGSEGKEKYVGTVVGCYSTDETFLVLDTKELINVRYVAVIKIID